VASALCANLFVAALSGYSLYHGRQQAELRAPVRTQNIAQAVDLSLSHSIERIDLALRAITDEFERQIATGGIDPQQVAFYLERYQQRLPEVEAIRVANADGRVVFGKGLDPSAGISWADRDYFNYLSAHPDGGLQISKPRMGRVAKTYIVGFARRYNHPDGSFAGVVSAPVSIDYFSKFLSAFDLGRNGGIVLRDADLGLIARYPVIADTPAGLVGNKTFSRELADLAASGVGHATYHTKAASDLKERIISFRRITGAPMMVLAGMDSEDYLAAWHTEIYKAAAWLAGFALLSILVSFLVLYLLRRMAEESLRNKLYLKNAGDGIHILNAQGNVVQASNRFCEMLGYAHDEIVGMNVTQWDVRWSAEEVLGKLLPELLCKPEASTLETQHRRKNGELIDVEVTVCGIVIDGKPMLYAASRDIGERKRSEAAERRQRESLASLNRISAFSHLPQAEQLQQALALGAAHLGLEFGIVSHIVDDAYVVVAQVSPPETLHNGQTFPFGKTYCQITIEQEGVVAIAEMGRSPYLGHPCYQAFQLEAYIGAPVLVRDEVFGTVNFSSPNPYRRGFDDGDREFVGLLARWVGSVIERSEAQASLAASEQRLRAIIDNEPECVKVVDSAGKLLQMNRAGLAMLEAESVEAVNASGLINFIADAHRQAFLDLSQRVLQGESGVLEFEVVGQGGTRRWLETHAAPLRDAEGKVVSLLAVTRDTTGRRHAESELRLAASVFNHAHEGIAICDAQQVILEVNPTFTEITGYERDEVLGKRAKFLSPDEHSPEFYPTMWQAIETRGFWEGEVWNRRKDGTAYAELLSISRVSDSAGKVTHYIGTFSDISVSKKQQAQLEHLAHYDALTGLPNRALLSDRMAQALSQARRTQALVAVGYLDLDGFKAINDEFGHDAGDALLIEVARRLTETLRAADTVARLGGDEFVLLLLGAASAEECKMAARRVLAAVAEPIMLKGHERCVSGSLGITLFPFDDSDADTLLRHADQAMYLAKRHGKNRFVVSSHTQTDVQTSDSELPAS
jgi:diguanylate cyclase (GGDEF)-like protein/PAS domain S-box-containing protein